MWSAGRKGVADAGPAEWRGGARRNGARRGEARRGKAGGGDGQGGGGGGGGQDGCDGGGAVAVMRTRDGQHPRGMPARRRPNLGHVFHPPHCARGQVEWVRVADAASGTAPGPPERGARGTGPVPGGCEAAWAQCRAQERCRADCAAPVRRCTSMSHRLLPLGAAQRECPTASAAVRACVRKTQIATWPPRQPWPAECARPLPISARRLAMPCPSVQRVHDGHGRGDRINTGRKHRAGAPSPARNQVRNRTVSASAATSQQPASQPAVPPLAVAARLRAVAVDTDRVRVVGVAVQSVSDAVNAPVGGWRTVQSRPPAGGRSWRSSGRPRRC